MSGLTFLAWRVSYQSDEQALRAAFDRICALSEQLNLAIVQLQAVAATTAVPVAKGITRSAGSCAMCHTPYGEDHQPGCGFAALTLGKAA